MRTPPFPRRMRALLALLLVASAATPLAAADHTGCAPNGYGYECHVLVGPVCHEVDLRVGQPSTWRNCTSREPVETVRDLLP